MLKNLFLAACLAGAPLVAAAQAPTAQETRDYAASCAICHDAHGARQNAHLINFMTRDLTGKVAVTASSSGQLEYSSFGIQAGQCFLTCHGSDHNPKAYPARTSSGGAARQAPGRRSGTRGGERAR